MPTCSQHCRHDGKPARVEELADRLRRSARKITGPRQCILAVLEQHAHPLAIREIFDLLPGRVCDLATVYRSMHLLLEHALVRKVEFGDGSARYELIRSGNSHHHHLVCTDCREIVELDECFPKELEDTIARRSGFRAVTHRLEFFGVCPRCAARSAAV
jgi:Fur family ferric uptake transcriptional regulator